MESASLAAAVLLALVHVLVGKLDLAAGPPRSAWLSLAGGASAAYVTLHLLPELVEAQEALAGHPLLAGLVEHPAFLLALAGILLFHGLDRLAAASAGSREATGGRGGTSGGVFALHIGFFAAYNAVLGHLMAQGVPGGLLPYAGALALHFTVNDSELREHHRGLYRRFGRWILAAAVLAGWAVGTAALAPQALVHAAVAVVAGGVLLNIFKDELPPNRQARYWAFLLGIVAYGGLRLVGRMVS